jgi:hypothetical protein
MAGKGFRYMQVRRRRDANHADVQAALERAGAFVADLSGVSGGCPDILARRVDGQLVLLEVKTDDGELREKQAAFIARWPDACVVVRTVDEALKAVGIAA